MTTKRAESSRKVSWGTPPFKKPGLDPPALLQRGHFLTPSALCTVPSGGRSPSGGQRCGEQPGRALLAASCPGEVPWTAAPVGRACRPGVGSGSTSQLSDVLGHEQGPASATPGSPGWPSTVLKSPRAACSAPRGTSPNSRGRGGLLRIPGFGCTTFSSGMLWKRARRGAVPHHGMTVSPLP